MEASVEKVALCPSIFPRVPPFIKFIPNLNPNGSMEPGPQYWDQDNWDQERFWRIPLAMENWIRIWAEMLDKPSPAQKSRRSLGVAVHGQLSASQLDELKRRSSQVGNVRESGRWSSRRSVCQSTSFDQSSVLNLDPFLERAEDAVSFMDQHPGVKLIMFARMYEIARKDRLGENFGRMQRLFPEDFNIHPQTFSLPRDRSALQLAMHRTTSPSGLTPQPQLWIIKPPNSNNGTGVRVITAMEDVPWHENLCVQTYIRNPYLIKGCKFDIRVYVLLTSMDPLTMYIYDDGLVRIATEKYSENPRSARNNWIHVTNAAVNQNNNDKYVVNDTPNECQGHKWRLKCLWTYLYEYGVTEIELDHIWNKIEEAVIKTILTAYKPMQDEFRIATRASVYNAYKLLGFDLLLDRDLKIHVIEVNARPALQDYPLDRAVNRPMLDEMVSILGFRIPIKSSAFHSVIKTKFPHCAKSQSLTFERNMFCRSLSNEDEEKQYKYNSRLHLRSEYLSSILTDLTTADVRTLIRLEHEFSQLRYFRRVFPTQSSHSYFRFCGKHIAYNDKLVDAYETKFADNRAHGVQLLQDLCVNYAHY